MSCHEKASSDVSQKQFSIALVGNPNCGKTTLFNALTGAKQHVGNWPGVTVERKSGTFLEEGARVEVIDLPGVYSLALASESTALDERIACECILAQETKLVVNIVDASNLERHLYLTLQLLEMGVPVLLAFNMMDVVRDKHIEIDVAGLQAALGCPIVLLEAKKGGGVPALKQAILHYPEKHHAPLLPSYPDDIKQAVAALSGSLQAQTTLTHAKSWIALRLLEDDAYARSQVPAAVLSQVSIHQARIQLALGEDADILIADARYQHIQQLTSQYIKQTAHPKKTWTMRLDSIVLNRLLGIPIFLGMMYLLFVFSINIGGAFQDFFDMTSQAIFVDGLSHVLANIGAPAWLTALLANGIGKGINTTVTFIPVIGALFLFLSFLEDSGYMARAAFIVDRFMRALGLPGKAFVPMIVGFGCNVPAVMAARTLESKRDRILTIMMAPFMSCGARLAIYAVFTAAFFPSGGQNVVFALYLIGVLMAIFTGFILRISFLKGDASPLVMELPPYHVPHVKTVFLHAWQRLQGFVFRAGKLIVPICVLIGALNGLNIDGSVNTGEGDTQSLLSVVGRFATPLFAPMGIQADNWPATVGLVTGVLAKEVVVGTLNTLYAQVGHVMMPSSGDAFHVMVGLKAALQSIPDNLMQLVTTLRHPFQSISPEGMSQGVYGLMYQQFDGQIGAFAYLLFVLLYFPCVSTTAVMLRELHRGWSIFSVCWMTGVAYSVAVLFYQVATWSRHPDSSAWWVCVIVTGFLSVLLAIRWIAAYQDRQTSNKTSSVALGETSI